MDLSLPRRFSFAFACVLGASACETPQAPDAGPEPVPEAPVPLDIDIRVTDGLLVIYARELGFLCECSESVFPDEGACRFISDFEGSCPCDPGLTAACFEPFRITQTNVDPERSFELADAAFATTLNGIDIHSAELTLHMSGCGGEMDVPLPPLSLAPPILRAQRVADGVELLLPDAFARLDLSEGAECGASESDTMLLEDAWVDPDGFDPLGAIALRQNVSSIEGPYGTVDVWHEHRAIREVGIGEPNADGTLTLGLHRETFSVEINTDDAELRNLAFAPELRATSDGELFSLTAVPFAISAELPVSELRVLFGEELDTIEIDLDGATFQATAPHVDHSVLRAEGVGLEIFGAFDFADVANALPLLRVTRLRIILFSRDGFVAAIE